MNIEEKNKAIAILKPIYLAFGQEEEKATEKGKRWVDEMKGILKSDVTFKGTLPITKESDLRRLDEPVERDVDVLMLSAESFVGKSMIYSCRKLAKLELPIIIWGKEGYASSGSWDTRGFLESQGAEAYSPLGPSEYDRIIRQIGALSKLKNSKVIIFGAVPNISRFDSCWDFGLLERRLGVEVKQIDMETLLEEFNKVKTEEGREVLDSWREDIERIDGPSEDEVVEVARLYVALKRFISRENADAITINCLWDLLRLPQRPSLTPCFPMAILTDEGIISGCEADLNILLSMQILHYVSGKSPIMGNMILDEPKKSVEENVVRLSHGVIPLSMCDTKFVVEDYHGQGKGVTAYCHLVENKPVTVARLSADLTKLSVIEGEIQKCVDSVTCRFSAFISVKDVTAIANNTFGYHQAMVYGDQAEVLKALGKNLGIEAIVL